MDLSGEKSVTQELPLAYSYFLTAINEYRSSLRVFIYEI